MFRAVIYQIITTSAFRPVNQGIFCGLRMPGFRRKCLDLQVEAGRAVSDADFHERHRVGRHGAHPGRPVQSRQFGDAVSERQHRRAEAVALSDGRLRRMHRLAEIAGF